MLLLMHPLLHLALLLAKPALLGAPQITPYHTVLWDLVSTLLSYFDPCAWSKDNHIRIKVLARLVNFMVGLRSCYIGES